MAGFLIIPDMCICFECVMCNNKLLSSSATFAELALSLFQEMLLFTENVHGIGIDILHVRDAKGNFRV